MDSKVIEALKNNKYPFGEMSEEMQAMAKEIGKDDFIYLTQNTTNQHKWTQSTCSQFWYSTVYRLSPDYATEPELIETPVLPDDNTGSLYCGNELLYEVVKHPDFTCFKSGGYLYGRIFVCKTTKCPHMWVLEASLHNYDVLPIDAVLFRKGE